ncbi:MAG TPA: hypothetical protein VK808_13395 [Bacteroidia bacterium]|jgi:hypothetical protein|nr:hypothetical protein [Bacteroidia bacterium]
MEVHEAAEILLKAVHDDINGRIVFSDFLDHQTQGYDERTSAEIIGIYNKALLVLNDEGLSHRGPGADIIELGQKGVDCRGDYKKYLKKKHTRNFLEKTRRILPIFTFVIAATGFYLTYLKKTSNERKLKAATIAQHKKDSIAHSKNKR